MKRPLGLAIICHVFGIVAGDTLAVPLLAWLIPGLLLAGACIGSPRACYWLLPVLLFVSGAANLARHQQIISPLDLRELTPAEPVLASVRGRVERVDVRASIAGEDEVLRASARVNVRAIWLGTAAGWQPAHGWILASTRIADEPPMRAGEVVEITGLMRPPPGAFAPGMFNYRAHLARREIYRQLQFEGERDLRRLTTSVPTWAARFQGWAMQVLEQGFGPDDRAVGLLWALCVGWLVPLTDEVSEPFMRSGTMHLFAISGQHIALIAGILVALLRLFRVPRRAVGWLVIPILWFYTAATGWQPSAIRSTIMMSVIILGWTLERPVDLLNSLAAAAGFILVWDPQQLFQAGFQLSFAVVASIGLLLPPIEQWRQRLLRTDPLLPPELRPSWQRRLDLPLRLVTVSFAVSLAAWLGSLPLIMTYFHLVTPVGLLANIVVVQLGSLALAAALGSLLCWPFAPWLAGLFNHAAWFFSHAMADSSAWFSELPGAWCYVKAPPLTAVTAYYLALWLVVSGRLRTAWRWAVPLLLGLVAVMIGAWHHENRGTRVAVLPLSGGHAVYLEQSGGENWLIDCGDDVNWRFRTRPFLQARGVNRLDHFVLTHGDVRHVGAATQVLAEFAPRQVVLNPARQRSLPYRHFETRLVNRASTVIRPEAGQSLGPWTILHPGSGDGFARADDAALVMQLTLGHQTILHAPDLGADGWRRLLGRYAEPRADLWIVSPPAEKDALARALVVVPPAARLIVVDSDYPAAERLSKTAREQLRARGEATLFTTECGAIEIRFRSDDPPELRSNGPR